MISLSIEEVAGFSGAAVVVDVMRAFTVAALALDAGAESLVLVPELEDALRLKREAPGSLAFQDGVPAAGFDLANSPERLGALDVSGRTIYQRTSAGTRGALAARHCRPLFCASFVCASATARALRPLGRAAIGYVITGSEGRAEEDLACASFIDALIAEPETDPAPFVERARTSPTASALREAVHKGYGGVHPRDVERCLEVDAVAFALRAEPRGEYLALSRAIPEGVDPV